MITTATVNKEIPLTEPEQVSPGPEDMSTYASGPQCPPVASMEVSTTPNKPASVSQGTVEHSAEVIPIKTSTKKHEKSKRNRKNKKKRKNAEATTSDGPVCSQDKIEPQVWRLIAHESNNVDIADAAIVHKEAISSGDSTLVDSEYKTDTAVLPLSEDGPSHDDSEQVMLDKAWFGTSMNSAFVTSNLTPLQNAEQSEVPEATATSNRTKLYVIKNTANKGKAMFATQNIARGTRILREAPVVKMPAAAHRMEILLRFLKLSSSAQAAYMSLSATADARRDAEYAEGFSQLKKNAPQFMAIDLPIEEQVKIMNILMTNAFSCVAPDMIKNGRFDEPPIDYTAVFVDASRMNHSCVPNVFWCWNPRIRELTVHAVRDIAVGEEITASYINVYAPKEVRQNGLKQYGFTCNCQACDLSTEVGKKSEYHRTRSCVWNESY